MADVDSIDLVDQWGTLGWENYGMRMRLLFGLSSSNVLGFDLCVLGNCVEFGFGVD